MLEQFGLSRAYIFSQSLPIKQTQDRNPTKLANLFSLYYFNEKFLQKMAAHNPINHYKISISAYVLKKG